MPIPVAQSTHDRWRRVTTLCAHWTTLVVTILLNNNGAVLMMSTASTTRFTGSETGSAAAVTARTVHPYRRLTTAPHEGCVAESMRPPRAADIMSQIPPVRYAHACQLPAARFVHWETYWNPTLDASQDNGTRSLQPPRMLPRPNGHANTVIPEPLPFAGCVFQTPGTACIDAAKQAGFVFMPARAAPGATPAEEYPLQEWYYASGVSRHPRGNTSSMEAGPRLHRVRGAVVNLVTAFSENFQHVPFDVLPLVRLVLAAQAVRKRRPHFLVLGDSAATFLIELGVRPNRIIVADPADDVVYCADTVFSPRFVSHSGPNHVAPVRMGIRPAGFLLPFQKKLAGHMWPQTGESLTQTERVVLYLPRPHGRARGVLPSSERALLAAITAAILGTGYRLEVFESVGDWRQDRRVFATAAAVVGPHGGAEANLVFCAPGTTVIEFNPMSQLRKSGQDNVRPCYLGLARTFAELFVGV
jgi:hypothetical protein